MNSIQKQSSALFQKKLNCKSDFTFFLATGTFYNISLVFQLVIGKPIPDTLPTMYVPLQDGIKVLYTFLVDKKSTFVL